MPGYFLDETRKLTSEQRKRIGAALGKLPAAVMNTALARIEFEMQNYLGYATCQQKAVKPKRGNDALAAVSEQADKLSQTIAVLPHDKKQRLEMWFNVGQLRAQKGHADHKYITVRELDGLLSLLRSAAHDSKTCGRPADRALHIYVEQVLAIFRMATGKWPTRRVIYDKEAGTAPRLVKRCLAAAGYQGRYPARTVREKLGAIRAAEKKIMDKTPITPAEAQ